MQDRNGITPIGVNVLKDAITGILIGIPEGMTAEELFIWLCGYEACQRDVLKTIDDLYDVQ